MTSKCLNKMLIEALKRAKPILLELGSPPYSAHYLALSNALFEVIRHLPLCDSNTTHEAITIYEIIDEEANTMYNQEVQLTFENPKYRELMKLMHPPKHEEEEEEEENEDWEVEEWDIDEEEDYIDEEDEDPCTSAENFITLDDFIESCLMNEEEDEEDP
jgi:hypothetical protein